MTSFDWFLQNQRCCIHLHWKRPGRICFHRMICKIYTATQHIPPYCKYQFLAAKCSSPEMHEHWIYSLEFSNAIPINESYTFAHKRYVVIWVSNLPPNRKKDYSAYQSWKFARSLLSHWQYSCLASPLWFLAGHCKVIADSTSDPLLFRIHTNTCYSDVFHLINHQRQKSSHSLQSQHSFVARKWVLA